MIDDGTYTAVLDRFEDDLAVLLVEGEEDLVGELVVEREELPEDGQHVDAVVTVVVEDGELDDVWYEEAETDERKESVQSRFDRLSERPPSDDDEEV
ncbi:hypothetical protein BV210_04870 [Halorientalis sp. IM1011]|uniref:DUF3006 domain-containing protein n=1 Tax=Halorientalis sp. IM1011 TaxID=1932360 RepID=UPI00097CD3EC|nr:DUF3006 domain-containing protein [Halorientalis sp. IM1011]AQL42086.1 hypothetical protein BV210_04870 [Halorientalis sp. IM1011]